VKKSKAIKSVNTANFSKDTLALNPHLSSQFLDHQNREDVGVNRKPTVSEVVAPEGKSRKLRKAPEPKTRPEREMAMMLDRSMKQGDIQSFKFEGMTLQFNGMRYTADFLVFEIGGRVRLVEVKGSFIRRTGIQAFQAAESNFPYFTFEMWQLTKNEWSRVL
jgi:hypothetical protein